MAVKLLFISCKNTHISFSAVTNDLCTLNRTQYVPQIKSEGLDDLVPPHSTGRFVIVIVDSHTLHKEVHVHRSFKLCPLHVLNRLI